MCNAVQLVCNANANCVWPNIHTQTGTFPRSRRSSIHQGIWQKTTARESIKIMLFVLHKQFLLARLPNRRRHQPASQPAQRTSDIVDSIQLSGGICVCNARDSSFTLRRMPPRPCDDSGGDGQIQRWSKPHIHIDTLSTCPNRNSGRQWRGMCFTFCRNYI